MKNKKRTYSLLIVVIGIWGYVGFSVLRTIKPKTLNTTSSDIDIAFNPKTIKEKDTFSIQLVNRDPFLGTLLIKEKKIKPKVKKEKVPWVSITYHGLINKHDTKTALYIITIGGQQHFVKRSQVVDGVKLINANSKEILVSYKGERKKILKS